MPRTVPFILAACTAVSILSTDLITPSVPDLPEALDTTINTAQLVVSVNLAAYALAQLIHGPVADAIGRKRLLLVSFTLFAVVSALCALAPSMEWLLAGRFMQGLLSSVPSVVIILMIRELYPPKQALAAMTLYGAALGLAPAIGPLLGGYLHVWFGWWAGFLFISVLALAVVLLLRAKVPESLQIRAPLNPAGVMRAYLKLLANGRYLAITLGTSLCFGAFYAYVTAAPAIYIDVLGMRTERYGLTNLLIVASFVAGNVLGARISRKYDADQMLRGGALCMVAAMIAMAAPVLGGVTMIVTLLMPMMLYAAGLAILLAAGPLVVLNAAQNAPQGPAAALLGSFQLSMASVAGYLSARFYDGTAEPMVGVMAGVVVIGAALILFSPGAPVSVPAD